MRRGEGATARAIEPSDGLAARALVIAERALRERHAPGTRVVALEAPVAPCERLLAAAGSEPRVLFAPAGAPHVSGFGVTHEVRLSGPLRFEALRRESRAIFDRLSVVHADVGYSFAPRLLGGAAFAACAVDPLWQGFDDGWFVLPRVSYLVERGRAWLVLAVGEDAPVGRALEDLEAAFSALEREPSSDAPGWHVASDDDRLAFTNTVRELVGAIERGEFAKVVAARRTEIALTAPIDEARVLARLSSRFPVCARFALGVGSRVFLGATPERLVAREGDRVRTEALAGSVAAGAADQLLASRKDHEEHQLVVDAIRSALSPLTLTLDVAREPALRELSNIVHMRTPIEGTLRDGVDVLALVEALHPTPAVCGVPTDAAKRFIAEHEPASRGLYAGPFGYVDANGDGAFVVALRSAFFEGTRAFVYAGAGVVRDSSPEAELAETDLKMHAILGALGADAR